MCAFSLVLFSLPNFCPSYALCLFWKFYNSVSAGDFSVYLHCYLSSSVYKEVVFGNGEQSINAFVKDFKYNLLRLSHCVCHFRDAMVCLATTSAVNQLPNEFHYC